MRVRKGPEIAVGNDPAHAVYPNAKTDCFFNRLSVVFATESSTPRLGRTPRPGKLGVKFPGSGKTENFDSRLFAMKVGSAAAQRCCPNARPSQGQRRSRANQPKARLPVPLCIAALGD